MTQETVNIEVTLFGETRNVDAHAYGERIAVLGGIVVGKFPTGNKLHRSTLTLWKRNRSTGRALTGATAAVVDGEEYVADFTLYTHNRNRGRIIAWFVSDKHESLVAKWNG